MCEAVSLRGRETWSRVNSCSDMCPCRRLSVIWAANNGFAERSTTELELNH
jgi:hypothetical protein